MFRQHYYFGAVIAASASQFFVNYLFSQALTIEDYGRFGLVSAALGIFVSLFMFGQATAITMVYFSAEKRFCRNVKQEVMESLKIMGVSIVVFGLIGLSVWHLAYRNELTLWIVALTLLAAVSNSLQGFFISLINCMDRYRDYFFTTVSSGVVLIGFAALNPSIAGYLVGVAASGIVTIILVYPRMTRGHGNGERATVKVFGSTELLLLGWVAIPGMFVSAATNFSDKFLLGHFLTLKEVAIYSLATLLSIGIGRVLVAALLKSNSILLMQNLQNQDVSGGNNVLHKAEMVLCVFCVIAAFVYYTVGKIIVIGIFGEKFLDAVPLLLALFIAVMVEGMMQFLGQVLIQKKRLYILVINGFALLLVAILMNYFFIPSLLIKGAVLTYFLTNMTALIVVYFQANNFVESIRFPRIFVLLSSAIFICSFFIPQF